MQQHHDGCGQAGLVCDAGQTLLLLLLLLVLRLLLLLLPLLLLLLRSTAGLVDVRQGNCSCDEPPPKPVSSSS
jgi:hypothetical protein